MKRAALFAFLGLALLAFAVPALAADLPKMELKIGHMSPANVENPYHAMAVYLQENLPKKTGGKLTAQVFHSGQIGRDRELMEALQFGTLDIAIITTSPMGNFVPEFSVLDFPFLFDDWDHVARMKAAPWYQDFLKESEKARFYTFSVLPRGFRSITNSKIQIKEPKDLKGLTLRVIESPIFVDTFTALGAAAQAMSWGEVFTALQQGTIDGHENALMTIYDERVYEVQKYVSLSEHIFAFCAVGASKALFDKLPPEYQKIVKETIAEGEKEIDAYQRKQEMGYVKKLEEKGMTFNNCDRPAFKALVGGVYDKYTAKNAGVKKYFGLIESVRAK